MPRRTGALAAVAAVDAKAPGKKRTIAAMDEQASALAERHKLVRAAAAYAFENNVGSKAALKTVQFKDSGVTYNMVEPLLRELKAGGKKSRTDSARDHHSQVLTNDERLQLGAWILACVDGQCPKNRKEVSAKVKEMLRARHASNKRRQWVGGSIRLNVQEKAVVAKVARLLEHAEAPERMLDAPFNPLAAGVLVPDVITRPDKSGEGRSRKRLSDLHGSMTMRGVAEEAKKRRLEDEAKAAEAEERKRLTLEKKEVAAREAAEREAAFALCEAGCACGAVPCPWVGWKRCPACGPKKGLCKVRACKAARQPLLLGYNPTEGLLEDPTGGE